jgi:hypothetical protein
MFSTRLQQRNWFWGQGVSRPFEILKTYTAGAADAKLRRSQSPDLCTFKKKLEHALANPLKSGLCQRVKGFLDSFPVCNRYPKNVASTFGGYRLVQLVDVSAEFKILLRPLFSLALQPLIKFKLSRTFLC